jgi:predicted O-methyltransferase YrrM
VTPEEVLRRAKRPERTRLEYGRSLYGFLKANNLSVGLELKSSPGISTAYIAGVIQSQGGGLLTTVSKRSPRSAGYDIRNALNDAQLSQFVSIYEEQRSYNWRLMKLLQEGRYEQFDFCIIEGHTWLEVGYASCLAERLLKCGGWLILDNLHFSFDGSRMRDRKWVSNLSKDERATPQIQRVFELLVQANPYFGAFRERGSLAFSQKRQTIWSSEKRHENRFELLIGRAVERARRDPEFRDELICSPQRALSQLAGGSPDEFERICFVDTDSPCPVSPGIATNGIRLIYLERPDWERCVDEETLEQMLRD